MRTYYDIIISELNIQDEFTSSLSHLHSISNDGIRLGTNRRTRVTNTKYCICNEIILQIERKILPREDDLNSSEYLV